MVRPDGAPSTYHHTFGAICLLDYPLAFTILSVGYFADPTIEDKADVIVVRYKKNTGEIVFSFRTSEESKVTAKGLAELCGGGGHKLAAGCSNPEAVGVYMRMFNFYGSRVVVDVGPILNEKLDKIINKTYNDLKGKDE